MLNELESIRRGLAAAGITADMAHPDVQPVSKNKEPLLVRLNANGALDGIELLPTAVIGRLWTFRKGKHNSFPLVSPPPLLDLPSPTREAFNKSWRNANVSERRNALCQVAGEQQYSNQWPKGWPAKGLVNSVRKKRSALARIEPEAAAVPEVMDRFLAIFGDDEKASRLHRKLVAAILSEAEKGIDDWLEPARAALVGVEKDVGAKRKLFGGEFYFDVESGRFKRDAYDPRNRAAVARTLSEFGSRPDSSHVGLCAITGESVPLHEGNFPQANLPALGLGYVFSKNDDLPATGSYRRFGHNAFPVGRLIVGGLAGQ